MFCRHCFVAWLRYRSKTAKVSRWSAPGKRTWPSAWTSRHFFRKSARPPPVPDSATHSAGLPVEKDRIFQLLKRHTIQNREIGSDSKKSKWYCVAKSFHITKTNLADWRCEEAKAPTLLGQTGSAERNRDGASQGDGTAKIAAATIRSCGVGRVSPRQGLCVLSPGGGPRGRGNVCLCIGGKRAWGCNFTVNTWRATALC